MLESSVQQQVSMTPEAPLSSQFFACLEDSSSIYQHRKRPRSGESPFDSSPASSTTTTDSMLTNSLNSFSDSSRSSLSRERCSAAISTSSGTSGLGRDGKSLSPPPLTFNLSSTSLYSPSPLTSNAKSCKRVYRFECRRTEQRRSESSGNDENEPHVCNQVDHNHNHQHPDRTHLTNIAASAGGTLSSANQIEPIQDSHQIEVDEKVFLNLVHRERRFETFRRQGSGGPVLNGQSRSSLLSWMLQICEHQQCQDEIFPLATIIIDEFLRFARPRPDLKFEELAVDHLHQDDGKDPKRPSSSDDSVQRELEQRQLFLFAACSLLIATKLRQTPRLYIDTLIEFSKLELPIELSRGEILDGELLILSTLKWDLAALVTPNEFLQELLARKCQSILLNFMTSPSAFDGAKTNRNHNHSNGNLIESSKQHCLTVQEQHELTGRVERHTQTLLELCLMDSQLSQYSSSVLAMSSMAVAINGLCKTDNNNNGTNCNVALGEIVAQIDETTNKVNELELMIDVAFQIEKYVQILLEKTTKCQSINQIDGNNEKSSP